MEIVHNNIYVLVILKVVSFYLKLQCTVYPLDNMQDYFLEVCLKWSRLEWNLSIFHIKETSIWGRET